MTRKSEKVIGQWIGKHRLTALGDDDTISRFGQDTGIAAEGITRLGKGVGPQGYDVIGAVSDRPAGIALLRECGTRD